MKYSDHNSSNRKHWCILRLFCLFVCLLVLWLVQKLTQRCYCYLFVRSQEIGLKSLTQITRGGVRIEKNPMLCYVETINWTAITTTGADHFISANKPQNECPVCASVNSTNDAFDQAEICPPQDTTQGKKGLCWNRQNCQRSECKAKWTQFPYFIWTKLILRANINAHIYIEKNLLR